jgi:hypothetical protein
MTVEKELQDRLVANGTVNGLIGTRIYPLKAPQNPTKPYVTFQRISGSRLQALGGAAGFGMARIQYDSWAITYNGAQALAAAIRNSFNGFIGKLSDGNSPASLRTVVVRLDNERDLFEEDTGLYRVTQDFLISHSE